MPTFAGFHPDFDIASYPFEIRAAIRTIAENFYVTRPFKPVQIGNSAYWAVLVRPTEEFSIYVNTDREIVILFSKYDTFEIRTLEAYDSFYDLLESKRADKSVRFLVSADDRVEWMIKHYLDQNPEYPIIIPLTFNQIKKSTNSLLTAVRRNYLLRDLFGYQNPLREENFFFGRQAIVNSVIDMAKSGQNSSLFGLRKSGKTSAIYAIQRKAKGVYCNVVVIDCQNPSVHARRYNELLGFILGEIRRSLGHKKAASDLGQNASSVSERFFLELNSILSSAKTSVLIIFDEIENISPGTAASPHWDGSDTLYFWQILRSYVQAESNGRISLCIVGTSPRILEMATISDVSNPMYLYAQKRFIPSLDFAETKEMVQRLGYYMGLEFSDEIVASLQSEFGGHPFFIRQVCSKIHQLASSNRPLKVSNSALERAKTDFSGQLEVYLRDIIHNLRKLYPEEFTILRAVVDGDKHDLLEFGREAPDLIDHLIGYGMVERVGADFDIRLNAIKSVLRRIVVGDSRDDRWAEISRRRNFLEANLRVALYHWSRQVSSTTWHDILEQNLTSKRLSGLESREPSVLFSSTASPLYLTDILSILHDSRVMAYLDNRRSLITRNLDTVNKFRKDAHANSFEDGDLKAVRESLDYLESEFNPP